MRDPLFNDIGTVTYVMQQHWISLVHALPSIVVGSVILLFAWGMGRLAAHLARVFLRKKMHQIFLENVIARGIGAVVFLFGVYLIFEMASLTSAALAVVSGTGLLGIVLGIAFRDITENFLASILLSIHHPFQTGDVVEIEGLTGYVQELTMRVTVLRSLEGHSIQIPNAMVYKSTIRNFTIQPHLRDNFFVTIGYDIPLETAQHIAQQACVQTPGVLKYPEPWVLVDALGRSSVRLRVYFWFDGSLHHRVKVRSCAFARVKEALQGADVCLAESERPLRS